MGPRRRGKKRRSASLSLHLTQGIAVSQCLDPDGTCTLADEITNNAKKGGGDPKSFATWVIGTPVAYGAVAVFLGVSDAAAQAQAMSSSSGKFLTNTCGLCALQFSTALGFICCCCGRYCCRCKSCCGCCGENRGAGCCGGAIPTRRGKGMCSCMGFVKNAEGTDFHYDKKEVWCARIFMWMYCFFLVLFMSLGQFRGNEGFTTAMKAWAESPQAVVDVVDDMVPAVGNFVKDMASGPLVDFFEDFGETLSCDDGCVDLPRVVGAVDCIIDELSNPPTNHLDDIIQFVDDMQITFDLIVNVTANVTVSLNVLELQMDAVSAAGEELRDHIDQIVANVDTMTVELQQAIDNVTSAIDELDEFVELLTNDVDGTAAIGSDLEAIETAPRTHEVDPSDDRIDDVTGAGPFTMQTIVDNNGEAGSTLLGRLNVLLTAYTDLPDYDVTADNMELFNDRVDLYTEPEDDNVFRRLNDSIKSIQPAVDILDGTAVELNITINNMLGTVRALDLGPVAAGLGRISDILNAITFAPLIFSTGQIAAVADVIPCMQDLSAELDKMNNTFMKLPDNINQIKGMDEVINASAQNALDAQQSVIENQETYNEEVENANLTGLVADLRQTQVDIGDSVDGLDTSTMLDALLDVENLKIEANVTNDITDLRNTLVDPENELNATVMENLRRFQDDKATLIGHLQQLVNDVGQYVDDGNTRECVDSSTACTSDDDCGGVGPERCTVSAIRFNGIIEVIDGIGNNVPDVSSATRALDSVAGDISIDTGDLEGEMNSAVDDANSVDSSELQGGVNDVLDSLNGFSLEEAHWGLGNLTDSLDESGQQLADQRVEIVALKDDLGDQTDQIDQLRDARTLVVMLQDLFSDFIPNDINPRLDAEELQNVWDTEGMGPLLLQVTTALDDVTAFFAAGAQALMPINSTNLTGMVQDAGFLNTLEVIDDPFYRENGPLFFIMAMQGKDSLVSLEQGAGGRVAVNAEGEEYPDGKECWTRECVNNYIDFMNNQPLEGAFKEAMGVEIPVPISRVNAMGLNYLLPLISMLLGFTASICFCSGYCGSCCAKLSCCCIGIQMPFLFGFMGIFFIFPLFLGDFCYGVENMMYRIVSGDGAANSFCNMMGGELDEEGVCSQTVSAGFVNLTLPISPADTIAGFLGGHCSNDPFEPMWTGAAESMSEAMPDFVDSELTASMEEFGARPQVIDVLGTFAIGVGDTAGDMILDIGAAVGCQPLNNIWMSLKNALCCETLNALYWAMGSWYLIAFTYLCCGCAANCLGMKRFRGKLWGKHYDEAKIELLADGGAGGGTVEMATGGVWMDDGQAAAPGDAYAGGYTGGQVAYGQGTTPAAQVKDWQ